MASETPDISPQAGFSHALVVQDFARLGSTKIEIIPNAKETAVICQALGLKAVRKIAFRGDLKPLGRTDWRLTARLGATITQTCVVTLGPVTTRIEEKVQRDWVLELPDISESGSEEEIPEDISLELLRKEIDLGHVLVEALGLALPAYPRAKDAKLEQAIFAAPGTKPMKDEETRPFAGLAGLRAQMSDTTNEDDGDT